MNAKATRGQMVEIFHNVKQSFQEMLDHNEWMDEQTKATAFEKLETLKILVGYMDSIFNETKLLKHYSQVSINNNRFS
jgi:predicted metalloendopeptidase